jgi:hypothetical protein
MPPIPATAEVSPIELDGISKLKVEVLFSKGSKLARTHKLDIIGGEQAETPKLLWVFAFATVVWVVPLPL